MKNHPLVSPYRKAYKALHVFQRHIIDAQSLAAALEHPSRYRLRLCREAAELLRNMMLDIDVPRGTSKTKDRDLK